MDVGAESDIGDFVFGNFELALFADEFRVLGAKEKKSQIFMRVKNADEPGGGKSNKKVRIIERDTFSGKFAFEFTAHKAVLIEPKEVQSDPTQEGAEQHEPESGTERIILPKHQIDAPRRRRDEKKGRQQIAEPFAMVVPNLTRHQGHDTLKTFWEVAVSVC